MTVKQRPCDPTLLTTQAAQVDRSAADPLLSLVHNQVRKAARIQMAGDRKDHALGATALVHEPHFELIGPRDPLLSGWAPFHPAPAESMRRILPDHETE